MEFLAFFTENLEAVKFLDTQGRPVDPRIVLTALAEGVAKVTFNQETVTADGLLPQRVTSQTWKIVDNE